MNRNAMLMYLIFETAESTEGVHSFEAMASVSEARWPDVQTELAQVLAWCHTWGHSHGAPDPMALEEGGEWDQALSVQRESSEAVEVHFDARRSELSWRAGGGALTRFTATLVLSGREAFAADFSARFLAD